MCSRLLAAVALLLAGACAQSFSATPSQFVGTWARSTGGTLSCSDGNTYSPATSGDLVITLGSDSTQIVGTQPDGCETLYTVTDNTASELPGQTCPVTLPDGSGGTETNSTHTLTLVSNLVTINESAVGMQQSASMSCNATWTGVFSKQ